jgi:hypothetical protein
MGAKAETKPTNSHFHQYYSLYKQAVTIVHNQLNLLRNVSYTLNII